MKPEDEVSYAIFFFAVVCVALIVAGTVDHL